MLCDAAMRKHVCECVRPKYKGLKQNPKMDKSTTVFSNDVWAVNITVIGNMLMQTSCIRPENGVKMSIIEEKLAIILSINRGFISPAG